jgi:death-on-curing protein
MIKFSTEKVLLLHRLMIEATGGSDGLRDSALLDSALEAAYATFDGNELFPSKEEKAARLGVGLISNHAFVDGNKRIGMYVLLSFLVLNGIYIEATDEEVVEVGLAVARGDMKYQELLEWILSHKTN